MNKNSQKISVSYSSTSMMPGLSLPEIKMTFLNGGKITIPSIHDGYVVASGCGSGKTTIIKQMIRDRFHEGILYSASTIKECNDMFKYIVDLIENDNSFPLTIDDIIMVHSDECPIEKYSKIFGDWRNKWNNDPDYIKKKNIVIITHSRLFNSEPLSIIGFWGNPIYPDDLSPQAQAINVVNMGNNPIYYPRQLILIDELPTSNPFKVSVDPLVIGAMGDWKTETYWDENEKKISSRLVKPKEHERPNRFKDLVENYKYEVEGGRLDLIDRNNEMSRRLIRYILGIIFDNFEDYVNKKDKINISYNISDLVLKKYINTRIILFDGTGDLTFKGSERFKLLTFKNKYSSPVNIEKFENHLDRKIDKLDDSEIEGKILENTRELHNIISSNSKTLIVTWMNLRSDEEDSKKKKSSKFQITSKYLNEDLRLPEIYSNNLRLIGHISDFEIIHYMSGLDKATNQFRDYDSIVFLGKFRVPNYVVGEFNREYRTGTDIDSYSLYQLVQAITRTRIRNHNGDPINIYFSNDWDDDMINLVKDYLSNEHIEIKNTKEAYSDMLNHIKPKWRKHAEILMKLDENLKDSILRSQNYYFEIELSRLYKLIPMKEKQVRSYYPMINYFRRLGIEINIIVDKENNNQYTVNREE
jgi:hypothetical protein